MWWHNSCTYKCEAAEDIIMHATHMSCSYELECNCRLTISYWLVCAGWKLHNNACTWNVQDVHPPNKAIHTIATESATVFARKWHQIKHWAGSNHSIPYSLCSSYIYKILPAVCKCHFTLWNHSPHCSLCPQRSSLNGISECFPLCPVASGHLQWNCARWTSVAVQLLVLCKLWYLIAL